MDVAGAVGRPCALLAEFTFLPPVRGQGQQAELPSARYAQELLITRTIYRSRCQHPHFAPQTRLRALLQSACGSVCLSNIVHYLSR